MILNDVVCWGVPFWRNSIIYKHRLSIIIFISLVWWDRVISRIDEKGEKIWKMIWLFFIPLISVFEVFDEMVVPVNVWMFPTDSHELEHPCDHMRRSDVKLPTPCVCGWDEVCGGIEMIIEHQSHSQHNTVLKYPVCQSECHDAVLFESDTLSIQHACFYVMIFRIIVVWDSFELQVFVIITFVCLKWFFLIIFVLKKWHYITLFQNW